ncbi:MAG: hypothetical protein ACM32E_10545 [Gemmatimonadota bacterium]
MAAGTVLTGHPAETAGEPARRLRRWPWLLAWFAFLPVAVLPAGELTESDTFWQIRAGLLILAHRALPAVDTFSWTARGKPWTLNSWGFDAVVGAAYRLAGLPGVAWACVGLTMAAAGLVLLLARRLGASPLAAGVLLLAAAPLLIGWLTARPQLADYAAMPALVLLLGRLTRGRAPLRQVAAIGVMSAVWVNLHAGALLAAVIPAACAVPLLARRQTRAAGGWCAAAAAAALAGSLASPYGLGVFRQAMQVQSASAGLVAEWKQVNLASPVQVLTLAAGLLALVLAVRRGDAVLTAALAVVVAGGVLAARFQPFVILFAVPAVAARASCPPAAVLRYLRSRRVMLLRCGTAGLVAWAAVAVPSLTHIGRPDPAVYPLRVVRDIPAGCRLFNSYLLGGFVILERPDVPVSLDSRNDLYGRQRLLAGERTLQGGGSLASGLRGAGCVLVTPSERLAGRLARDPGWRRVAAGPAAILFVRR